MIGERSCNWETDYWGYEKIIAKHTNGTNRSQYCDCACNTTWSNYHEKHIVLSAIAFFANMGLSENIVKKVTIMYSYASILESMMIDFVTDSAQLITQQQQQTREEVSIDGR